MPIPTLTKQESKPEITWAQKRSLGQKGGELGKWWYAEATYRFYVRSGEGDTEEEARRNAISNVIDCVKEFGATRDVERKKVEQRKN